MSGESSWLRRAFDELKRRKVVQVGAAYAIVGWLLIQVADASFEHLGLPGWATTLVIALVILGFPLALVLAWALEITPAGIQRTRSDPDSTESPAEKGPAASIAVLPFVNISGDPDNEYFSDGLSEELLNLLARIPELRVCSRTSAFAFKGKGADMKTIRQTLGVATVLEGSVRRAGARVRITAQLIDAAADAHLWSQTFDREIEDIFAVQDEISANIVQALKLELSPATRRRIEESPTDSVQAYDYYLRGRELYHRADKGHLAAARQMYERAIEIDPRYAVAWAGLAICCADHYRYHEEKEGFLERAEEASRKAVELNPDLAEAQTARGLALWCAGRFAEAGEAFERAIRINPSLFEPYHFYARMIRFEGLEGDVERLLKEAARVRPEDFQSRFQLANLYDNHGREAEGDVLYAEALRLAEAHLSIVPSDVRALYLGAQGLIRNGENARAMEWAERALKLQPDQSGVLYNAACIYALVGQSDRALELLEQSIRAGMAHTAWITRDPDLDSLRSDPRFERLVDSI